LKLTGGIEVFQHFSLIELARLGEKMALLTVNPNNIPSIKVIEKNGGRFEDVSIDPETGKKIRRYWIELKLQQLFV